ncbi:MAG: hypothetical protein M1839_000361 [Geoglossum umbratile]|nr:MAG: hypothetical protein M1839_000361 [Geoglossum umbratile]
MVVDPFSALGVAGNIVQFVDFTSKLFSKSRELYKSASGTTAENEELGKVTRELQALCVSLASATRTAPESARRGSNDAALRELSKSCKDAADELLTALGDLKAGGPHRRWQSFYQALRTVWKKEKIRAMEDKIASYRNVLGLQLMAMQQDQQSSILTNLQTLFDANRRLGVDMAADLARLKSDILNSIQQLSDHITIPSETEKSVLDFLNLANKRSKETREPVDVVALSRRLSNLADIGNRVATAQKILESLRFNSMEVRHSKIADAHPYTFNWILQSSPGDTNLHANFVEWLRSDDPMYWISGKPGSGKSTLIKYLVDEKRTGTYLRKWAGEKKLVTASFFFWIAGTELQKSQEGLLQSLLYEVLRQCPDLISTILPFRWQGSDAYHSIQNPWTRSELLHAFSLLKKYDVTTAKFCFFIDGLDEYEGEHAELISIIRGLIDSSNVKICVSSRPWNVFEEAFGNNPVRKLYLQDFNKADIRLYVKNKLEDRSDFIRLKTRDSRCRDLISEIVDKAQGVFLWVFLVVRSLVQGLSNSDRVTDLQRRLRQFPSDLEAFFSHILMSLEPVYREQTARAFQISLSAAKPLSLMTYWFLDLDEEDPDFAITMDIEPLSLDEIHSRHEEMKKRLNGRCKGLIEVSSYQKLDYSTHYQVEFLHRTVRDFLMTKDMQVLLANWSKDSFDAHLTICRTILAEVKSHKTKLSDLQNLGPLTDLLDDFMYYAREAEAQTNASPIQSLNELDRVVSCLAQQHPIAAEREGNQYPWEYWVTQRNYNFPAYNSLLTFAIERNLSLYVQYEVGRNTALLKKKLGRPLLDYAMRPPPVKALGQDGAPHVQVAAFLLSSGADPNHKWAGETVWERFLASWLKNLSNWPTEIQFECLKLFMLHGANPKVKLKQQRQLPTLEPRHDGSGPDQHCLEDPQLCGLIKKIFPPSDATELLDIMSPKRLNFLGWAGWKKSQG